MSAFCGWCGGEVAALPDGSGATGGSTDGAADGPHARCRQRLAAIDPPRYCGQCARRMVVQVDPMGWTARCSRHGETTSADADRARERRAAAELGSTSLPTP